jgi:hypothetical protein
MSSEQMSWLMNAGFKTLLGALSGARLALLAVSVFRRCGMMCFMMGGGRCDRCVGGGLAR